MFAVLEAFVNVLAANAFDHDFAVRLDVDTLIGLTPKRRQLLFFSATVPDKIKGLAKKHMQSPLVLNILEGQTIALENIEQRIYMMTEEQKLPKLCQMLTDMNPYLAIVFCNTKNTTDRITGLLRMRGIAAQCIHGDIPQRKREEVMQRFRDGKLRVFVATDVASRGIDVDDVDAVFNYEVPEENEYYVHRIGRTGRAEKHGVAYTLLSDFPSRLRLDNIARNTRSTIVPAVLGEDGSVTVGEK